MRVRRLSAVLVLALSCALLTASCLQGPADERASEQAGGTEPIGEAQQPAWTWPVPYGSKDFPFVVAREDDGKDEGGGWQEVRAILYFGQWIGMLVKYEWKCPIVVGMPRRSKLEGRISASRAAYVTAEVANAVVPAVGASRDTWENQGMAFCAEIRDGMRAMFKAKYGGYGVTVSQHDALRTARGSLPLPSSRSVHGRPRV
jgi:hypothetical protein